MEHIKYFVLPTLLMISVFSRQKIRFFADFTLKIVIMAVCIPIFFINYTQSRTVKPNKKHEQ